MTDYRLIVGLGNPGRKYRANRHNVGFMVVDQLAERNQMEFTRQQSDSFVSVGAIGGAQVVLAKPQTFMNKSGISVAALRRFYKVADENLLVIFDDLDLPVGTIRIRPFGGSSGHNGMKSLIERLGTQGFPRLRIGIGKPPGKMDPARYVLKDFDKDQRPIIEQVCDQAARAVETWIEYGIESAMTEYNGSLTQPE
ncbi:MAG: aminoacyl-tRNA hydrolase [Chloroflexota bacterium]